MNKTALLTITGAAIITILALAALSGCENKSDADLPPLPKEDGLVLYNFLMKEAPELVSQAPCSCCGRNLDYCYTGGCPPSCVPCNRIGRDAYRMHKRGASEEEILKEVERKYFSPR